MYGDPKKPVLVPIVIRNRLEQPCKLESSQIGTLASPIKQ